MAKATAHYLSQREKEFLHEKTLEVLRDVGIAYNSKKFATPPKSWNDLFKEPYVSRLAVKFMSSPSDYDHLARRQEWASGDADGGDE